MFLYILNSGQFMYVIRKRMKLAPEKAIFLFVNNFIPSSSQTVGDIYYLQKNSDGYLYVGYSCENTFGSNSKSS